VSVVVDIRRSSRGGVVRCKFYGRRKLGNGVARAPARREGIGLGMTGTLRCSSPGRYAEEKVPIVRPTIAYCAPRARSTSANQLTSASATPKTHEMPFHYIYPSPHASTAVIYPSLQLKTKGIKRAKEKASHQSPPAPPFKLANAPLSDIIRNSNARETLDNEDNLR